MKTPLTKLEALKIAKDTWRIISEHNLRSKGAIKDVDKELHERIDSMVGNCSLCQFVAEQAVIADKPFELNSYLCSEYCPCYVRLHCLDYDDSYEAGKSSDSAFDIWCNSEFDEEANEAANNIFNISNAAYELELELERSKGVTRQ